MTDRNYFRVLITLAAAFCFLGMAVSPGEALGQEVRGTVTDAETGTPLPGVNVVVEEEPTIGAATNNEGEYELTVPSDNAVLVFRFVGYRTQREEVAGRDVINVSMVEDRALLEEVIVVGYGTQRRADVTGAVSAISPEELEERPITNTALGLQGVSPGLTVQYQGGQPGEEDAVLRVRGTGTLNNPNPLVLVDGVEQPLSTVEPSNIASISVLKDAASAAIYGSRAANGVILIETRRGVASGLTVSYNGFTSVQNMLGWPEKASDEDWMRLQNEADAAAGNPPTFSEEFIQGVVSGADPLKYPWANWEEGAFRDNAMEQNHQVSVSAGGDVGRVYGSVNYVESEGVIQNFGNRRVSGRINSDLYLTDKLTAKGDLLYRDRKITGPGFRPQRIAQAILHINRNAVMSYPDGQDATGDLLFGSWNAFIMANSGETNRDAADIVGTAGLNYEINDALTIEGDVTVNNTMTEESLFRESRNGMINYVTGDPIQAGGWFATNTLQEGRYGRKELSNRLLLNYTDTFGSHDLGGLLGYEEIHTRVTQASAARSDFFNNELRSLSSGDSGNERTCRPFNDPGNYTSGCFRDEWGVRSFFGRANYSYDDRYRFQANVRYDGSSRFAEGNRWGVFPSFSAGWRISNERFMEGADWLSNLSLRASWGQLGNERISANERSGLFNYLNSYNLGLSYQFGDVVVPAAAVTSAGNPDISWETTTMTNIGADIGLLEDRVEIVAEYFRNYTSGILLDLPIPPTIGVSPPTQNAGEVSNTGWELQVTYRSPFRTDGGLEYDVSVSLSDAVNKIESLAGQGPFYPDKFSVWAEGYPISALRGFTSPPERLYRSQEDLQNYPVKYNPNADIGDIIYEDLNDDGALTQSLFPAGDQIVMASEDPRYEFGVNLHASFKRFDLTMFWQGVLKQYHSLDGALMEGPNWNNFTPAVMARERYHPEKNPDGTWPRVIVGNTWNLVEADFWLQDTKYARLKQIQLGFTVPQRIARDLRVYVSGQNLLTFTPTELFDPETPRGRSQFFPHVKSVSLGVNATF